MKALWMVAARPCATGHRAGLTRDRRTTTGTPTRIQTPPHRPTPRGPFADRPTAAPAAVRGLEPGRCGGRKSRRIRCNMFRQLREHAQGPTANSAPRLHPYVHPPWGSPGNRPQGEPQQREIRRERPKAKGSNAAGALERLEKCECKNGKQSVCRKQ